MVRNLRLRVSDISRQPGALSRALLTLGWITLLWGVLGTAGSSAASLALTH